METIQPLERTLTRTDHVRLARLLATHGAGLAGAGNMEELLACSELVASTAVPATVVTMYTQVLLQDPAGGKPPYKLTPCYPDDAEPGEGFISVLSPAGMALLGRRAGEVVHWRTPRGDQAAARIVSILFQPEATGDYQT